MKGNWHLTACMKCWGVGVVFIPKPLLATVTCPECAGKGYRIWVEGEPALDIESVELP
jgi:excinuclease UvrABC ATPase subunit